MRQSLFVVRKNSTYVFGEPIQYILRGEKGSLVTAIVMIGRQLEDDEYPLFGTCNKKAIWLNHKPFAQKTAHHQMMLFRISLHVGAI